MKSEPLTSSELNLLRMTFARYPQLQNVTIFGSRAKGTHLPNSDVDLSLRGNLDELEVEALAADLDELPLPYHFDVLDFTTIANPALREHIERVGIQIYPADVEH